MYVAFTGWFWRQRSFDWTMTNKWFGVCALSISETLICKMVWFAVKEEKLPTKSQTSQSTPKFGNTLVLHWYSERNTGVRCNSTCDWPSRVSCIRKWWWSFEREGNRFWWNAFLKLKILCIIKLKYNCVHLSCQLKIFQLSKLSVTLLI